MCLPRECDRCKRKFTPFTSVGTLCEDCLREIRILNGRMRNENFKKMFKLENIKYRRI
jgi:hypothetical protein